MRGERGHNMTDDQWMKAVKIVWFIAGVLVGLAAFAYLMGWLP